MGWGSRRAARGNTHAWVISALVLGLALSSAMAQEASQSPAPLATTSSVASDAAAPAVGNATLANAASPTQAFVLEAGGAPKSQQANGTAAATAAPTAASPAPQQQSAIPPPVASPPADASPAGGAQPAAAAVPAAAPAAVVAAPQQQPQQLQPSQDAGPLPPFNPDAAPYPGGPIMSPGAAVGGGTAMAAAAAGGAAVVTPFVVTAAAADSCQSEQQMVMCGDIPFSATEARRICCDTYRPRPLSAFAAAAVSGAVAARAAAAQTVARPDLDSPPTPVDFQLVSCAARATAEVPVFTRNAATGLTTSTLTATTVPALTSVLITRIKTRAKSLAPAIVRSRANALRIQASAVSTLPRGRGAVAAAAAVPAPFNHPGGYVSALELAAMQQRLKAGTQPQAAALSALLTGTGVPPKVYAGVKPAPDWFYPTDTPAVRRDAPMAMRSFLADYGGAIVAPSVCPSNYPKGGPQNVCGHVALVEIDAQGVYKQAMAYRATADPRYAQNALTTLLAWANTNVEFGLRHRNGPLEAAWAGAAAARAAELLRGWPGLTSAHLLTISKWLTRVLLPQMDHFQYVIGPAAVAAGRKNLAGNWEASIADAKVAIGVLSDNRTLYNQGVALARATIRDYFKWGRGASAGSRVVGECTETMRDVYHSLFGLGSLLQAAETAFSQEEDVFSELNHVMAAGMELHARLIRAALANDKGMLPPGFKFYADIPPPGAGCSWSFDIEGQKWTAVNTQSGAKCRDGEPGVRYVIGAKWLPSGFELGYNHYAGRLGLPLPETRALLSQYRVDYAEFSWGLGTLSHANTARDLWRGGFTKTTVCSKAARTAAAAAAVAAAEVGAAAGDAPLPGIAG